jgi:hypothetical protein
MKTLIAFLALASALPMGGIAAPRNVEIKLAADVKTVTADVPNCVDGMEPGTICRYVPLNALTVNVPSVAPNLPPLPLRIILPAGMRSINAQLHLEVSPTTVCDPAPSDVYDGVGGLKIDCEELP